MEKVYSLIGMLMDLNHSPLFWYDTAGLFIQAGFLWFAASKVERPDWLYGLSFVATSILSVFSALWPVFDFETANIIRHCLHASTALSFASFSVMAWQDYKERGGQNSLFSFTFKVVGASFLGLVILAWLTVSALISLNGASSQKTERELSVIKQKAATASDVSVATYSVADTNRLMLVAYGDRLGKLEGKVDRLLVLVSGVPEIRQELWGVKKEMRQIRVDFSKRPAISLPPPTLKPKVSSSIFLPVERVQPVQAEGGKGKKKY